MRKRLTVVVLLALALTGCVSHHYGYYRHSYFHLPYYHPYSYGYHVTHVVHVYHHYR